MSRSHPRVSASHVGRVIGGHVGTQPVRATHEAKRRDPLQVQPLQVSNRGVEPLVGDRPVQPSLPEHSDRFDVNEIRGREIASVSNLVAGESSVEFAHHEHIIRMKPELWLSSDPGPG